MKKQELIQLHLLFHLIESHYENRTDNQIEHDEYHSHGVSPQHVHKCVDEHETALQLVADDVSGAIKQYIEEHEEQVEQAETETIEQTA